MKLNSMLVPLVILMFVTVVHSKEKEVYAYRGSFYKDVYRITKESDSQGRVSFGGDRLSAARFCGEKISFFCFSSFGIAFAVPKDLSADNEVWEVDGLEFSMKSKNISLKILGQEYDNLYIISGPVNRNKVLYNNYIDMFFIYSVEHGLLGFSYSQDDKIFWLEQGYGFAAKSRIEK